MTTIELVGGPCDGLIREVDATFPDYPVEMHPRPGYTERHVYRLTVPAVVTQGNRVKYEWVKPE